MEHGALHVLFWSILCSCDVQNALRAIRTFEFFAWHAFCVSCLHPFLGVYGRTRDWRRKYKTMMNLTDRMTMGALTIAVLAWGTGCKPMASQGAGAKSVAGTESFLRVCGAMGDADARSALEQNMSESISEFYEKGDRYVSYPPIGLLKELGVLPSDGLSAGTTGQLNVARQGILDPGRNGVVWGERISTLNDRTVEYRIGPLGYSAVAAFRGFPWNGVWTLELQDNGTWKFSDSQQRAFRYEYSASADYTGAIYGGELAFRGVDGVDLLEEIDKVPDGIVSAFVAPQYGGTRSVGRIRQEQLSCSQLTSLADKLDYLVEKGEDLGLFGAAVARWKYGQSYSVEGTDIVFANQSKRSAIAGMLKEEMKEHGFNDDFSCENSSGVGNPMWKAIFPKIHNLRHTVPMESVKQLVCVGTSSELPIVLAYSQDYEEGWRFNYAGLALPHDGDFGVAEAANTFPHLEIVEKKSKRSSSSGWLLVTAEDAALITRGMLH